LLTLLLTPGCGFGATIKEAAEAAAVKAVDHAGDKLTGFADQKHKELMTQLPAALNQQIESTIAPKIAAEYIKVQEEEEGPFASLKAWFLLAILTLLIGKDPAKALIARMRKPLA
jgi:hypothetical protein